MDKFPFIEALKRLDTTGKKVEHLRSWHHGLAKENGISTTSALRYDIKLDHHILPHVDDEGVLDCKAVEAELVRECLEYGSSLALSGRHLIGQVLFNTTAHDVCPGIDLGTNCQ